MMNGLVRDDSWNIVEMKAALEVVGPRRQPADRNKDQSGRQDEKVISRFLVSQWNGLIISAPARNTQR
jgi:hypothetical protein